MSIKSMQSPVLLSYCLTVLLSFIFQVITISAQSDPQLLRVPFTSTVTQESHNFFLYLPKDYNVLPDKKWPVMLFLHGNGERGNGQDELDWVMVHGPLMEAWVQKRDLPFIIISPQLPMFGLDTIHSWIRDRDPVRIPRRQEHGVPAREPVDPVVEEMTGDFPADSFPYLTKTDGWELIMDDLLYMVRSTLEDYRGDPDRVYLTGLSYGGFGTWTLAASYPEMWAAILPIAGWGHPDIVGPIARHHIPVWAFAGGRDPVVPVRYFYPAMNRLKAMGHPDVRFTVHEDMGHDVWKRVYAGDDAYHWLLSQRKP